jgi:hypothetical protein
MGKCRDCRRAPAGERDQLSPFCGKCDPDGHLFYEESFQRLLGWASDTNHVELVLAHY